MITDYDLFVDEGQLTVFIGTYRVRHLIIRILSSGQVVRHFEAVLHITTSNRKAVLLRISVFVRDSLGHSNVYVDEGLGITVFFYLLHDLIVAAITTSLRHVIRFLIGYLEGIVANGFRTVARDDCNLEVTTILVNVSGTISIHTTGVFLTNLAIFSYLSFFHPSSNNTVSLLTVDTQGAVFANRTGNTFLTVFTIENVLTGGGLVVRFRIVNGLTNDDVFLLYRRRITFFFVHVIPGFSVDDSDEDFCTAVSNGDHVNEDSILCFLRISCVSYVIRRVSPNYYRVCHITNDVFRTTIGVNGLVTTITRTLIYRQCDHLSDTRQEQDGHSTVTVLGHLTHLVPVNVLYRHNSTNRIDRFFDRTGNRHVYAI